MPRAKKSTTAEHWKKIQSVQATPQSDQDMDAKAWAMIEQWEQQKWTPQHAPMSVSDLLCQIMFGLSHQEYEEALSDNANKHVRRIRRLYDHMPEEMMFQRFRHDMFFVEEFGPAKNIVKDHEEDFVRRLSEAASSKKRLDVIEWMLLDGYHKPDEMGTAVNLFVYEKMKQGTPLMDLLDILVRSQAEPRHYCPLVLSALLVTDRSVDVAAYWKTVSQLNTSSDPRRSFRALEEALNAVSHWNTACDRLLELVVKKSDNDDLNRLWSFIEERKLKDISPVAFSQIFEGSLKAKDKQKTYHAEQTWRKVARTHRPELLEVLYAHPDVHPKIHPEDLVEILSQGHAKKNNELQAFALANLSDDDRLSCVELFMQHHRYDWVELLLPHLPKEGLEKRMAAIFWSTMSKDLPQTCALLQKDQLLDAVQEDVPSVSRPRKRM